MTLMTHRAGAATCSVNGRLEPRDAQVEADRHGHGDELTGELDAAGGCR